MQVLSSPLASTIDNIADKVYDNERLSPEDGVALFNHPSLPELSILANHAKERLHPATNNIVTYVVGRNVNYTIIPIRLEYSLL